MAQMLDVGRRNGRSDDLRLHGRRQRGDRRGERGTTQAGHHRGARRSSSAIARATPSGPSCAPGPSERPTPTSGSVAVVTDVTEQVDEGRRRDRDRAHLRADACASGPVLRARRRRHLPGRQHDQVAQLLAPPDQLIGRTIHEVMAPGPAALVAAGIRRTLREGVAQDFDVELELPAGPTQFHVRMAGKRSGLGGGDRARHTQLGGPNRHGSSGRWNANGARTRTSGRAGPPTPGRSPPRRAGSPSGGVAHDVNNLLGVSAAGHGDASPVRSRSAGRRGDRGGGAARVGAHPPAAPLRPHHRARHPWGRHRPGRWWRRRDGDADGTHRRAVRIESGRPAVRHRGPTAARTGGGRPHHERRGCTRRGARSSSGSAAAWIRRTPTPRRVRSGSRCRIVAPASRRSCAIACVERSSPPRIPVGHPTRLSVVHGVVEEAGGRLQIDDREGGGAVIRFVLPATDARHTGWRSAFGRRPADLAHEWRFGSRRRRGRRRPQRRARLAERAPAAHGIRVHPQGLPTRQRLRSRPTPTVHCVVTMS